MNKNFNGIREKVYDLEMYFEQIVMLAEIIKDFGDYNDELLNGAEKMQFLAEMLSVKCSEYKKILEEFIPELQKELGGQ